MDEHGHNKELEAQMQGEWDKQEPDMSEILKKGATDFLAKVGFENNRVVSHETVCCMDEGTAHIVDGENKFAMAGSGILFPASSWSERLDRVADLYIKLKVKKVTSHDGCGAAGIAWKRDGGKEGTGGATADEYGRKWVSELQKIINDKLKTSGGGEVEIANVGSNEMVRPEKFHNARVIWFDGVGDFNPHKLGDKVPKGFLIEYGLITENAKTTEENNYPFAELQVAIDIALGSHGLGNKFTKESPFLIVILARDETQASLIKGKINSMIDKFDSRVKLDCVIH